MGLEPNKLPGVTADRSSTPRRLLRSEKGKQLYPGGIILNGSLSADPLNTGDVRTLRYGLPLGKISATGLWAPSIIGITGEALDGAETALTVGATVVTELVRRVGASGTFKLIGPPAASGTVRTATVTYSAAATTTITMTALGVAEVQTITASAAPTVGDWYVRYMGDDGVEVESAAIAYNDDAAAIQVHIRAVHADLAAVTITDSGSAGLSDGTVTVTWPANAATSGPHALLEPFAKGTLLATAAVVSLTCARSATGINGEFVTGSWISPTDGSETILGLLGQEDGIKVTDQDGTDMNVSLAELIIAGCVDASQIINYPADASLIAYLKAALRANGGPYIFEEDY